jgi:hypothetical protein
MQVSSTFFLRSFNHDPTTPLPFFHDRSRNRSSCSGPSRMASAAYEHPANNEKGVIVHPEHFKSEKTRAQVKAETEAAMRQGRLSYGESNYPMPAHLM